MISVGVEDAQEVKEQDIEKLKLSHTVYQESGTNPVTISVVLPTFNNGSEEYIETMEMIMRKIGKLIDRGAIDELVIVDGSRDKDERPDFDFIKFIHRDNRQGFKAGALVDAMPKTKGEIIVIFDADWIPHPDFLRNVVRPFADKKVAIVQTRQGFYNKDTNLITRFAAYTLMIYHSIMMPINNKINCVFFCGTAGALRKSAVDDAGGWTPGSVTEDSDLSVRLLMKGYKTVYLESETPSEVPDTFESFIKQQMRWCYGNARVFFDNFWKILTNRTLKLKQKFMIAFITLANSAAPFVVIII